MSDSDIFETVCPYCDEIHHIIAPNRSVASYIFLNSIKPSLVYRQHMWKCSKCPCHTFSASDLQKILKEIMLYDKKNGEFLNPKPRTRSDTTSRRNHLAITPTFPDKNPCMTKYKMDKLISKILKLDPDSQIEAHFEIGGGSNKDDDHPDGIYHYHIYAHTTFSLVQQNNKILSNISVFKENEWNKDSFCKLNQNNEPECSNEMTKYTESIERFGKNDLKKFYRNRLMKGNNKFQIQDFERF